LAVSAAPKPKTLPQLPRRRLLQQREPAGEEAKPCQPLRRTRWRNPLQKSQLPVKRWSLLQPKEQASVEAKPCQLFRRTR